MPNELMTHISNYAKASVVACEVGEQMVARLDWVTLQPNKIIHMADDNSYCAELLRERYPKAELVAMDAATALQPLPFADGSVDLIVANLLLPWCSDIKKLFAEWRRILRPEGLLMFSSLGPDTLIEVQNKFSLNDLPHFIDMHIVGDELTQARFADPVLDVEVLTLAYRDVNFLFEELLAMGMIAKLPAQLDCEKNSEGVFPITYEIIYGHAWGPDFAVDHVADASGEVRIPLAHLRRKFPG